MIKCELFVDGYSYRVTDDVRNWDDIIVSIKRSDYDGVVRSFTSKFEFVNSAHLRLKNQYMENYLEAAASVVISRRNNNWGWNELFRCTLDFSTYEDSGNVISINAVDDSVARLIKAKKGAQYEYMVDTMKENEQLLYDGLEINNSVNYAFGGGETNDDGSTVYDFKVLFNGERYVSPLMVRHSDEVQYNPGLEFETDESYDTPTGGRITRYSIAKNTSEKDIHINFIFDFTFSLFGTSSNSVKVNFGMYRPGKDNSLIEIPHIAPGESYRVLFDNSFILTPGQYIYFKFYVTDGTSGLNPIIGKIKIENKAFKLGFASKGDPVYIDVLTPSKLLNRLLKSINNGSEGLVGEIESFGDDRLNSCMIIAAESARGIQNAKIYSSFSKFCEWMKAEFGYVYDISDKKVRFMHRTKYFSSEITNTVFEFDDFSYRVNSSLIYSQVRVGYDRQEYDSINGRDEFRFTNVFTTGCELTSNSLDLISPYRADAYGLEFLVQKRGADTTDTSSDDDVFIAGVEKKMILTGNGSLLLEYELLRSNKWEISGVISPSTMFNTMYSPRSMLLANREFIGVCANKLTYASGEGNSDVLINGVGEKEDMLILEEDRLFTVGELSFNTPNCVIPDNQTGIILLTKGKEKYQGYILKADMNAGREECTKFTLAVKKIE